MQWRDDDALQPLVGHPLADARIHRFNHKAMATEWAVWISHEDEVYAGQAAWEVFLLLERLEAELSRFDPNSDIARINLLRPGEILPIGAEAFGCLQLAGVLFEASGGAFDVTAGGFKEHYLRKASLRRRIAGRLQAFRQPVGMEHLHLERDGMTVWRDVGVEVDLGAIGKGYAVDRMVELLGEWGLSDFLIHGGASSVAARGHAPGQSGWPATLRHPCAGGGCWPTPSPIRPWGRRAWSKETISSIRAGAGRHAPHWRYGSLPHRRPRPTAGRLLSWSCPMRPSGVAALKNG